jgi:hypothetical protein
MMNLPLDVLQRISTRCLRGPVNGWAPAALLVGFAFHAGAHASSGFMYIPTPCENEWESTQFVKPQPAQHVEKQAAMAEGGDADAQYFMALAASSADERSRWLKKAIDNGSKGAAAYYAHYLDPRWKTDPVDPAQPEGARKPLSPSVLQELLQPVIEAAEAGEPQAATWLMYGDRFRWDYRKDGEHPILKRSDVPKWAEIAARGGNPAAAEALCSMYDREYNALPDVEKDDAKAFYWCSVAAPRTCAGSAKVSLAILYAKGRGTPASKAMSDFWRNRYRKWARGVLAERVEKFPGLPIGIER